MRRSSPTVGLVVGALVAGALLGTSSAHAQPLRADVSSASHALPSPWKDPAHVSLSALRPSAGSAKFDMPVVYSNGCHNWSVSSTKAHFCYYGDKSASKTVVLFGDSHEAQWFSAFDAAARSEHVKLLYITKTACPAPSVSMQTSGRYYHECDVWRENAIALIKKRKHVDLIVLGGSANSAVTKRHTGHLIKNSAARAKEWQAGVRRTVTALRGVAGEIVIIRDTPHMRVIAGQCLISTGGGNRSCQTTYPGSAASTRFWAAERAVAGDYAHVVTSDFTSAFCSSTRCRPVTSTNVLRWRDRSHMTKTFSKLLAPRVRTLIHAALAGTLKE